MGESAGLEDVGCVVDPVVSFGHLVSRGGFNWLVINDIVFDFSVVVLDSFVNASGYNGCAVEDPGNLSSQEVLFFAEEEGVRINSPL